MTKKKNSSNGDCMNCHDEPFHADGRCANCEHDTWPDSGDVHKPAPADTKPGPGGLGFVEDVDAIRPKEYADGGWKDTNPKDAAGITKIPYSTVSAAVMSEVGLAMTEGSLKYGRHNYRVAAVRASVYFDACVARHMARWWEGEDIDPDTIITDPETGEVIFEGLSHITKAIAGLVVLRDAMIQGSWFDDRPPPSPAGWQDKLNRGVTAFLKKYPQSVAAYLSGGRRGPGRQL